MYKDLYFFLNIKCKCCLDGGGGNKGCGQSNNPVCTVYGTNPIGTGAGTCAQSPSPTGTNYDSFVRDFCFSYKKIL